MERPEYLGVYNNNYALTQEEYPFRVAIKRYINGEAEFTNYGYFQTVETAAYVYNIYALSIFGKGAVINDVEPSVDIELEVAGYCNEHPEFCDTIDQATSVLEAHGQDIKIHRCIGLN